MLNVRGPNARILEVSMIRTRYVAALSLLFTVLFFIEYTPLLPRMRIPYDLEEFHYPLADYAFQALKQGRFPQWDPTIYCGLSFADNITTGIYYPPTWLMFALKWGSEKLSYRALEYLALAHVWLAFLLCYAWLHGRRKLHWLASILGAGGYAFGGYLMGQLQHLGLLAGYAWLPLAFLSVDEAEEKGDWRPLWKLALASAMCWLGGYPPFWIVFALCSAAYAFARRAGMRLGMWTSAALACSLLFSAVALLPALEATRLKIPELKYSRISGFAHPEYYLSYFIPNYFKFDLGVDPATTALRDYLYLGGAGIVGLALLLRRKKFRDVAPLLAVLLVSLLFLVNPTGLLGWAIEYTPLAQVMVDWDFLAGVSAALAALAAFGIDFALARTAKRAPSWSVLVAIALALAWSVRLLVLWNGPGVASGANVGMGRHRGDHSLRRTDLLVSAGWTPTQLGRRCRAAPARGGRIQGVRHQQAVQRRAAEIFRQLHRRDVPGDERQRPTRFSGGTASIAGRWRISAPIR